MPHPSKKKQRIAEANYNEFMNRHETKEERMIRETLRGRIEL